MKLYKHWNNTDVAMCVLKKYYIRQKHVYKLKVLWFNIVNPNNIYSTGVRENITIDATTFNKNWSFYS